MGTYSKRTPIGALHAEEIAEEVLLYLFRMALSASLSCQNNCAQNRLQLFLSLMWTNRDILKTLAWNDCQTAMIVSRPLLV